jgi:ribosome maturation factor RimP
MEQRVAAGPGSDERAGSIGRLVEPALEAMGYALVRVTLGPGRAPRLQVMMERRDGRPVGVDDCAAVSRELSALLDVADPIGGAYTLEVSSPGIDRPLTRRGDFTRFAGHEAQIELNEPVQGQRRFRGRIVGTEGEAVILAQPERTLSLPIGSIRRAKLVLTDELLATEAVQAGGTQGAR